MLQVTHTWNHDEMGRWTYLISHVDVDICIVFPEGADVPDPTDEAMRVFMPSVQGEIEFFSCQGVQAFAALSLNDAQTSVVFIVKNSENFHDDNNSLWTSDGKGWSNSFSVGNIGSTDFHFLAKFTTTEVVQSCHIAFTFSELQDTPF